MLILPKEQFFVAMDKRLDKAYCYVWDQMAVEKHMMMWRSKVMIFIWVAQRIPTNLHCYRCGQNMNTIINSCKGKMLILPCTYWILS